MRRGNFLIAALTALATFISLQALVGHRGWNGYNGRYGYYRRHHGCYENNSGSNDRDGSNRQGVESKSPSRDSAY